MAKRLLTLIYHIIRCCLGLLFLYSGIAKLSEPEVFAVLIEAYGLLPEALVYPSAILLIMMELIAGAGLLFNIQWALELLTLLLVLFICVLVYGIKMGLNIDCGCLGSEDIEYRAFHGLTSALYRDLIMLGGIIYLYLWRYHNSPKLVPIKRFYTIIQQRGAK